MEGALLKVRQRESKGWFGCKPMEGNTEMRSYTGCKYHEQGVKGGENIVFG
jgi:hypothetical protein